MENTVVVIGSNSFSGSHFVDYILQRGVSTIGISRSPEPHEVFLPYKKKKDRNFTFHQLDLNHDLENIMEVINSVKADYVINFAAQSMVGESWEHPEHWYQTNVISNVLLHKQLRNCSFLSGYVHISTPEVYGSCSGLVKESHSYHPSTPYAVSRSAADMHLKILFDAYQFPVIFTRAANVFGPGQQLYRIIPRTILFFLTGRKLQLHGGGVSVRSFIHIRDVADGTWKAATMGKTGSIYHFSTRHNISIHSLVEMISNQMSISFEDNVEVGGERLGKDSAYLLDASYARDTLGWEDKINLEQGIEETIGWVKQNLEILQNQPMNYIHKP